jgi:hypothetical protein
LKTRDVMLILHGEVAEKRFLILYRIVARTCLHQRTIHLRVVPDHSERGAYIVNSEAKFNVRHGHWRCWRNGHETDV